MPNNKIVTSRLLGFGELLPYRCVIYDSDVLDQVLQGKVQIHDIKPIYDWSFEDHDAIPFELVSILLPNKEQFKRFYVGNGGESHRVFIERALKDIKYEKNYSDLPTSLIPSMKFTHEGRLWKNSKVIILKSYEGLSDTISNIRNHLALNNIDISSYNLLELKKNKDIKEPHWGNIVSTSVKQVLFTGEDSNLPLQDLPELPSPYIT